jgi:hypothetical protein
VSISGEVDASNGGLVRRAFAIARRWSVVSSKDAISQGKRRMERRWEGETQDA